MNSGASNRKTQSHSLAQGKTKVSWTNLFSVDGSVARAYSKLLVNTRKMSVTRVDLKLLFAATAVAHNLKLAILKARHLECLPRLAEEN